MTWPTVRLRDIVDSVQSGFASGKKAVPEGYQHLRMNNIDAYGKLDLSLVRRVPRELAMEKYRLNLGDLLVCTTNSGKLVGKSAIFNAVGDFAFSNHLTRIRLRREIAEPRFVQKQLWFRWVHGEIEPLCKHWVNQSTLPKENLLELEFVLPDIESQRRISDTLDRIVARLDSSRLRLDSVETILRRFRISVLAAGSSGRLTQGLREPDLTQPSSQDIKLKEDLELPDLPPLWRYARLSTLASGMKYGTAKRCAYEKTGRPVLRIPNIGDGELVSDDMKYGELSNEEYRQLALEPGDLLIIRSNGSVSLVGKAALVSREFCGFAYAGYLIRVRPNQDVAVPGYLNYALAAPVVRRQIELAARSTSGVHNINSGELGNLVIPLPPRDEQAEIVKRVDRLLQQARAIQARYDKADTFTGGLMPSLFAKAYRGELSTSNGIYNGI